MIAQSNRNYSICTDKPQTKPPYPKEQDIWHKGTVLIPPDQQQAEINGF